MKIINMRILSWILLLCPIISNSQVGQRDRENSGENKGIHWTTGLTWDQVKEKAKLEKKYIFLDIFATWCGPCKMMDKDIYTNDSVGDFFNDKFICIKVQADQTNKDNDQEKKWYTDAEAILKEYRILAYPTYIFLSPEGVWVHKAEGFQLASEFIQTAQTALQPSRVYIDPNNDFYQFVQDFENGSREYGKMILMRKKAIELGYIDFSKEVSKVYKAYLSKVAKTELYKKENLEYLSTTYISSTSPFFKLFYPNGDKADKIVKQKGFASRVIDNTIQVEKVLPFFKSYNFIPGGRMMGGALDSSEADWNKLTTSIRKDYHEMYTERNVLDAKITWYEAKFNDPLTAKYYFIYLDKYGMDTVDKRNKFYEGIINDYCWKAFESINDKAILQMAIKWMELLVKRHPENYLEIDTYANLLHKLGRTAEAIPLEEKALALTIKYSHHMGNAELTQMYTKALNRMKNKQPTWKSE